MNEFGLLTKAKKCILGVWGFFFLAESGPTGMLMDRLPLAATLRRKVEREGGGAEPF